MTFRDWKTTMKRVGLGLLLLAIVLLLVLLGINFTLIASEIQESRYAPPPPPLIPLPIAGWLAWLLWLGPLVVVLLAFAPGIVCRLLVLRAIHMAQREPEGATSNTPGPLWSRGAFSLRLVLLLLAVLAQFLVIIHVDAFDTSGTLYLNDVVIVSHQEAWAAGFFDYNVGGGHPVLWHYSAGQWGQVDGPDVSGLTALPDGEVWGVGDAGWLEHESKGNWMQISSGTADPLTAVAMRTSTDGWAVGGFDHTPIAAAPGALDTAGLGSPALPDSFSSSYTDCRIVHDVAGTWSPVPCPVTNILRSVSVLADGSAWAVGDLGTILHEIGGTWVRVPDPTRSNLRSVAMVSPDEGWAVGEEGTILHYTRGHWQLLPQQTTNFLDQVVMVSPDEGWIVGDRGTLFHNVRGNWQEINWSSELTLYSVSLLAGDATAGWIVGADYGSLPRIWQKQGADWHPYQSAV